MLASEYILISIDNAKKLERYLKIDKKGIGLDKTLQKLQYYDVLNSYNELTEAIRIYDSYE